MLNLFRRNVRSHRKPLLRRLPAPVRLTLERLEGRDLPAPLVPTGLTATGASTSSIALTWNRPPDPTVTGFNVYEQIWIPGTHSPRGSGGTPGHYVYSLRAGNLTTTADTLTGLATGSHHTYVVKAVDATGQSAYSAPATAETWIAPSLPYGSAFLLPSGALFSSPVAVTAGLTTQVTLLAAGNPLNYSVLSGPSTVSINAKSGVVTYTPALNEVGTVKITFQVSNPLGAVTQTIQFNVAAPNLNRARPTLKVFGTSSTFTGQSQPRGATAVGKDGKTPVAGSITIAYNGNNYGYPLNAGTYQVLATFTSADPNYRDTTLLTSFTVNKATPAFSSLGSPTIARGTATTTVSGHLDAGTANFAPVTPKGQYVVVTLNGVPEDAVVDASGNFSATFATAALPVGSYTVTYDYGGDANFTAARSTGRLTVAAPTVPQVTLNPTDVTVIDGYLATFTAAATGLPAPTVQWQVSTDGGKTYTNLAGATSTTLSFVAYEGMWGYRYRAVFTNSAGIAVTTAALLTVNSSDGIGGDD
jgi:hypothetical protein